MTTTNLADFGRRELQMAGKLLQHYAAGRYEHPFWTDSGVQVMMNQQSGNVFLTDDDSNVLMMNGFRLEAWYTLPYSGKEGFFEDFEIDGNYHREDVDYLDNVREILHIV
jgi:hypothetical protein